MRMKKRSSTSNVASERLLEHIDIEITKKCNLSCVHCSAQSDIIGKELNLTEIKAILDEASSLGLRNVGLTGGEPLLRRNKLEMLLRYCKQTLGVKTHLHTNGTLIKEKDSVMMAKSIDDITLTFFGSNPETHDRITSVQGSFEATEKGFGRLVEQDANIRIFIVPMRTNFREIPQIVKRVREFGCNRIRILSLAPVGRARDNYESLALNVDNQKWLEEELARIRRKTRIDIDAGFCTQQTYSQLGKLQGHKSCFAAENRVHINAFGDVFPCTASSGVQSFSAGNVKEHTHGLSEIWRFSPIFQFLRYFHAVPPKKCQNCSKYAGCMSGCRVMIHYKYKDITAAKPDCKPLMLSP